MRATVVPFRTRARLRYSPGIAAEAFMEVTANLGPIRSFVDGELRRSWEAGLADSRMRELQGVSGALGAVERVALTHAGWADAVACADGKTSPGHGRAA